MKFLAIIEAEDYVNGSGKEYFTGSNIFGLSNRTNNIITKRLKNIHDETHGLVVGIACNLDLEESWKTIMSFISPKETDLIFQFELDEDDVVFGDFTKFMSFVCDGSPNLTECFRDKFSNPSIAFASNLRFRDSEKVLIVGSNWTNSKIIKIDMKSKKSLDSFLSSVSKMNIWK